MSDAVHTHYPDFVETCGWGKVDGICGALSGEL